MIEYPLVLIFKRALENSISLDIGCGTSPLSSFIATHCHERLVSIDVNKTKLYENNKTTRQMKVNSLNFVYCDAQTLPFKSECFDNIYNVSTFEHIPNDRKAIAEMFRVMKKEATAIVIIPFSHKPRDPTIVGEMWQRFYTLNDISALFGEDSIQRLVYCDARIMNKIAPKLKKGWFWIKDFFIATFCIIADSKMLSMRKPNSELASIVLIIGKK